MGRIDLMNEYKVLLFYKYINLENPEFIVLEHLHWCLKNDIKGRVFFPSEGVNATVSGLIDNIQKYK